MRFGDDLLSVRRTGWRRAGPCNRSASRAMRPGLVPGEVTRTTAPRVGAQLRRTVQEIKGADPLAPVTVVCPSGYASVFVRRELATSQNEEGTRGVANLNAVSLDSLVEAFGVPLLASRGLRLASGMLHLEALRTEALTRGGWVGHFAHQPRALAALELALLELGLCPPGALEVIAGRSAQAAELVDLLHGVRRRLHTRGFADRVDLASAAVEAAASQGPSRIPPGSVVTWQLGRCTRSETVLLRNLGARHVELRDATAASAQLSEVHSFPDPEEEARHATRCVVEAAERGVALWKQAVFHPPGGTYPRLILQHLTAAGIGANGPGLRPLSGTATSRALLGLLDLSTGEWGRDEVMAWLATSPLAVGPGRGLIPTTRWDVLSASAGVIKGVEQWKQRLALHAEAHPRDAAEAGALSDFVTDLESRTRERGRSWRAHSQWALGLLDTYSDPDASRATWPQEEREASAQLRRIVASLADLDELSEGSDLGAFRTALELVLRRTALDSDGTNDGGFGDGVFVGHFGAARGLRFGEVVVCGLADSIVPGAVSLDLLVGEDLRMSDASGTLRTRATVREDLHEDLLSAVEAGTDRRVGTMPRRDPRTGRSHVPSRWLEELSPARQSWRTVDSFASVVGGGGPAVSLHELELRGIDKWVGCGGDPSRSPVANVDERLAAGFDAVRSRQADEFTRFDGLVGAGRVSPFDPGTPVSATRFEAYAHCPRRYLFERALAVSRRVRPEELWQIEPAERGSLIHAALESYVAERIEGAPRSFDRLLAIAHGYLERAEQSGLVGKPLLWRIDRAAILRDLRRFHEEEGDLRPLAVELAFGNTEDDSSSAFAVKLADGRKVYFRGSVDRVDVSDSGRLVVSDYKTGKQRGLAELLRDPVVSGKLLQLPLYALAARDRFGSNGPVHARYWLLSTERSAPSYNVELSEAVEGRFGEVIGMIASGVESGCFPPVPGAPTYDGTFENCRHCDFDEVCPAQRDRQWSRKRRDGALGGVVRLVHDEPDSSLAGLVTKNSFEARPARVQEAAR